VLWEKYRIGEISKDLLRYKRFYDTFLQYNCDDIELARKIGEIYVDLSSKSTNLFPGAIETLSILSKNYRQFILTNGFKEVQHIKVKNCKLDKYVERVFTSEEAGQMKPSEVFYNYVLEQLNVKSENCLMIGDDESADIEGAKKCNISQVLFNPNNKKTKCTPTYEINKLKDLLNILYSKTK
ncbi:MAG: HAD-IA family hydrolase, partial [Candidatus Firestonebacteria bacterium]|nr:HAD-IA family hydrolase [Candidatus Firestonebacteria bacterium]